MLLGEIIRGTGASILIGSEESEITSICCDSRKVKEGSAFIAVKGCNGDGHDYIDQAVRNGAVAVIGADRKALALCADNFYSHPSGKLCLVGITGTNGKNHDCNPSLRLVPPLGIQVRTDFHDSELC